MTSFPNVAVTDGGKNHESLGPLRGEQILIWSLGMQTIHGYSNRTG